MDAPEAVQSCWPLVPPRSRAPVAELSLTAPQVSPILTYLPASVRRFPGPVELAEMIAAAGFRDVRVQLFAGGIVALHTAEVD